jgi:hypothetical protein
VSLGKTLSKKRKRRGRRRRNDEKYVFLEVTLNKD